MAMFIPKNQDRDNLTSGQIQQVLDTLIIAALTPVILATRAFDQQLTYLLCLASVNKKRKISALETSDFIARLCNALVTTSQDQQVEIVASCKIERSILMGFVSKFLSECETYEALYEEWLLAPRKADRHRLRLKLNAFESNLNADPAKLYPAIVTARDFLSMAYAFRNEIVERYVLHCQKFGAKFIATRAGEIDSNDLRQNLLTAVTKSLDKYDSSKGALTSFLNFWLLGAAVTQDPEHGHEYGIAYTVPQSVRKGMATHSDHSVNFSYSLDREAESQDDEGSSNSRTAVDAIVDETEELAEEEFARENKLRTIRVLAKQADHKGGIGRLYLNIDETFSKSEKLLMKKIMQDQGTH